MDKRRSQGRHLFTGEIVLYVLLLLVLVVGLSSAAFGAGNGPAKIKVGAGLSLTGMVSSGGKDIEIAYKIAVSHINGAGGVYVKEFDKKIPIELIVYDSESSPPKLTSRLEKLVTVDKVDALLGDYTSFMAIAGAPIAEKYKIPWVGGTCNVESLFEAKYTCSYCIGLDAKAQIQSFFAALDRLPEADRPTKFADFQLQNDWGLDCAKYLKELCEGSGGKRKLVYVGKYAMEGNDFSSIIMEAKAAGADAIWGVPMPDQAVKMLQQMKQLRYSPKAICFIRGPDLGNFWEIMGEDTNYVMADGAFIPSFTYPKAQDLARDWKKQAPKVEIGGPAGLGYASVQVLADAIERAGTLKKEAVIKALTETDLVTVTGRVQFVKNGGGRSIVPLALMQWQNGNREEVVSPKEQITAPVLILKPWDQRQK